MFVTGQLEMVGQAALTATKVRVTSHLPLTNDHYNVTDTEVRGHISASADWVGLLPKLSILNGYSLTPNTHQLTIDGNFYQYASNASYGLQMDNSDDYVIVTGDATFHGGSSGTTPGAMADGELHLRGDFAQTTVASTHPYTFQPTGMAVVFDGTNPQTISFDSVGATTNYFDDLRIENSQGVTDTSSGMFVTGQLEMVGQANLTATKVRVTSALPLTNDHYNVTDTEVRGHISASGDWVGTLPKLSILNGYSLTPNTHHLTIDGNFYQYASNASYGLQMDYGTDQVTITGDATFHGGSNASSTGAMTAGELHLGGNFAQTTVAPTHPYTFQPTGTAVVFDGTNPQTISFASVGATTNYFDDLRIENPQGVTDTSSGMFVTGQLEMVGQGALTATKVRVTSALPLTNDHYSVTDTEIRGHINASADWVGLLPKLSLLNGYSLTANGHHLTIDGDYAQSSSSGSYGLQLHNGNDRVTITGDAVFTGATTNSVNTALTAGEVWFQGNFQQVTTNGFQPNGTATVFNGGGTHTVSFASSGGNWFDDMTVAPGNALNITTTTQVNGASTLNGDITNASTFSTLGTLTLANGITVTNNGTIRYRAGYTDNGATIIGPSPVAY